KGYSLAQQLEALREYAEREGYEVLEEVSDPGQSGASLERPGMDRVRDLVGAGGVTVVLAQDRDRFSREPAYTYLLKREFEERGTIMKSLNDRGGGSPEGQLTDGILDQLAKFERAKMAERSRRGKLRKAREGKIIANGSANYGFVLNKNEDGYEVDEEAMSNVRRLFYIIGVEGRTMWAVRKEFEERRIPTPRGKGSWAISYIRKIVGDDIYRPHSCEEVAGLLAPEVAAKLDKSSSYGIWWWGRARHTVKNVAVDGPSGRSYRRRKRIQPSEEGVRVAVPVPDGGIPREWVDAAREAIKDNVRPRTKGRKLYELAGLVHCGCCGRRASQASTFNRHGKRYFYYRCPKRNQINKEACTNGKGHRAEAEELAVWEKIRAHMTNPAQLREDLERSIELARRETSGDPDRDAKTWAERLAEAEKMRVGYQEQAARGYMTLDELGKRLEEIEDERRIAERELQAARARSESLSQMEEDKEELLERYERITPAALDTLTDEERNKFYRMLRLKVLLYPDKPTELEFSDIPAEDFFASESSESVSEWEIARMRSSSGIRPPGAATWTT
ncbi:MAG: recombinase family protein, partial [Rubrobacteraceae bacterium]